MARSPKVLPNTGVDGTSRSRPPQVSPDVGSRRHGGKWRQLFSGVALTRRNCPIGATFPHPCLGKSVVPYHLTLDTFCTKNPLRLRRCGAMFKWPQWPEPTGFFSFAPANAGTIGRM